MGESESVGMEWNYCSVGMRFLPTDEELIDGYLRVRLNNIENVPHNIIKELNVYDYEPWELQSLAFKHGMYFFTAIKKKHGSCSKINRLTKQGYWRASQSCSPVLDKNGIYIGTKRPLVYYTHDATKKIKGQKADWLMNEYMLAGEPHDLVLCEIHHRKPFSSSSSSSNNDNLGVFVHNPSHHVIDDSCHPIIHGESYSYGIEDVLDKATSALLENPHLSAWFVGCLDKIIKGDGLMFDFGFEFV